MPLPPPDRSPAYLCILIPLFHTLLCPFLGEGLKQSEQLKAVKLRLYEKYTSGSITKAEYLKRKAETDTKMSENEEAIRQGHERMQELNSEHPCSDERLDAVLGEYQKGAGFTYELAHALISAIYVHGHDSIEIVWKLKDIFEDAEI